MSQTPAPGSSHPVQPDELAPAFGWSIKKEPNNYNGSWTNLDQVIN